MKSEFEIPVFLNGISSYEAPPREGNEWLRAERIHMINREVTPDADRFEVVIVKTDRERAVIFEIRMKVFVEEQNVPVEEELDAYDATATHFAVIRADDISWGIAPNEAEGGAKKALSEPRAIGTARMIDKGAGIGKIGRVAILKESRGKGLGFLLMRSIEAEAKQLGFKTLILEAQLYAVPFYEKLGYVAEGEIFLDANIEHRLMKKELTS